VGCATLLLIRHATNPNVGVRVTGWSTGVRLDEKGRIEAADLAEFLAEVPISAIYSSPLERALETAAPLAEKRSLPVRECAALGEIRYGDWQGQPYSSLSADPGWARFSAFRSFTRPPSGEMMVETQARMISVLHEIAQRHEGETVAVFSHGDAIRSALLYALGGPLDFFSRLEIRPASITILDIAVDKVLVKGVNIGKKLLSADE
jgi:broad specificity phosphatase PhoE